MDDVAEEAGLARRTIYLHFPGKEALVSATIDQVVSRTQAAMEEPLREGSGLESLQRMLTARILVRLEQVGSFHHAFPDIWEALYPHSTENFVSYFEPEVSLIHAALEKGLKDGSVDIQCEPRAMAELLLRATNGFLPSNLSRAEVADTKQVREHLAIFIDVLLFGIAAGRGR